MQATLYNLTQPTNLIDKSLGAAVGTISVTPKEPGPFSVTDPIFIVDKGTVPATANYIHIPEFNRYYFITSISYDRAKRATFVCHVDVLKTYSERIKNTTLNYIRGEEGVNEVDDDSYPLGDYIETLNYDVSGWSNSFDNTDVGKRYVLRVAASGVKPVSRVTMELGEQIIYQKWLYTLKLSDGVPILENDPYGSESYNSSLPRITIGKTVIRYNNNNYTLTAHYPDPVPEGKGPSWFVMTRVN